MAGGRLLDYVLTDLFLPVVGQFETALYGDARSQIGGLAPLGLSIALMAINDGARVAIVSDVNHHQDAMVHSLMKLSQFSFIDWPVRADLAPIGTFARDLKSPVVLGKKGIKTKNWVDALEFIKK